MKTSQLVPNISYISALVTFQVSTINFFLFHGITETVSVTVVVSVSVVVVVDTDCIELSNHKVEVQPTPRSSTANGNSDA